MVKIKVKKLHPDAKIPHYEYQNSAGLELTSIQHACLEQGQRMLIKTGLAIEVPDGYVSLIWPRSGLSVKKGTDILAGVIDSGYRGEYGVVLLNTGYDDLVIKPGDRIAQLLIQPIVNVDIEEVSELSESTRGENGFGSTAGHSSL
jgi:dUTP pyrophosphatase